jgi:hypothetical protein
MFASLPARELSVDATDELVAILVKGSQGVLPVNGDIPAGYTYLGQFVDHDLTFDPVSRLQKDNDPFALVNFRTPRFDLDSVYGAGPADQPFLYESRDGDDRGVKLLVGKSTGTGATTVADLPRNQQGRALIGDARNDENLIVAQLHLLFVEFHNKVVVRVRRRDGLQGAELFREAQRIVRWHYQWIVVNDLLRTVAGDALDAVLVPGADGPAVRRRFFHWEHEPFMPIEFSGAAYRFGHSMVRSSYEMNSSSGISLFAQVGVHADLGGFRPLPPELVIDWRRFFALSRDPLPQPSLDIDARISPRLFALPEPVGVEGIRALPLLNLRRARALGLPAGPDVAHAMGHAALSAAQLGLGGVRSASVQQELLRGAPLWYYVLCEAGELMAGACLGPVGGTIVAEVLIGLLEADPNSFLSQWPTWRPELPGTNGDFTMADLVRFVHPRYRDA